MTWRRCNVSRAASAQGPRQTRARRARALTTQTPRTHRVGSRRRRLLRNRGAQGAHRVVTVNGTAWPGVVRALEGDKVARGFADMVGP